jgi:uncharacterized membrane protein YdjX (TVP38/TMEM64 family)
MTESSPASPSGRRKDVLRLVLLAALIALAFVVLRGTGALSSAEQVVRRLRVWRGSWWLAPAFVLGYAALSSVAFPAGVLTIAGGALFGVWLGSALNFIGAMLGATGAYVVCRSISGPSAERLLGHRHDIIERLRSGRGVFRTVLRLRLVPIVPFNLINVASGVARVPFPPYLLATMLGTIPATIIYTYFADALVNGLAGARRHAFVNLGVASALLIALSLVPAATKRMRRG